MQNNETVNSSGESPNSTNSNPVIWFTGLSGSGKTTIATALKKRLSDMGFKVFLLDGDVLRSGLNSDLGFSDSDRTENLRRAAEVAKTFAAEDYIVLCSFVSPRENLRSMVRKIINNKHFTCIYVMTPLEICELRDIKGLYAKARANLIPDFTGISAPFEVPANPDVTLDTTNMEVDLCVNEILNYLTNKKIII